jgi:RsiW-degrading membrane proteinase PrsW (M82 family)
MKDDAESAVSAGMKQTLMAISVILMVIGLPLSINLLCAMTSDFSGYGIIYNVFSCLAVLLTLGVGLAGFIYSNRSIQKKPSNYLRLPPMPLMMGAFGLLLVSGIFIFLDGDAVARLFFPPILILLAALPPLWSVAWFMKMDSESNASRRLTAQNRETLESNLPAITWRRGMMAFIGGATIGVFVALVLEIVMPAVVLALVVDLADVALDRVSALFDALAGSQIAEALTNPGFIYVFIQLAVIAPLAEEIAKPLALLPVLRRLNRSEAFLLGALAGAGFAAVENVIYAASGNEIWSGILLVRSLGGALHPLGAGLMALAWRDILCKEQGAGSNWITRFAIAVGVHAAWNGGSLLVITIGGAGLFGELPEEIGILGVSAAGAALAFLILLGISALWMGRAFGRGESPKIPLPEEQADASLPPSERTLAIWALACLTAIVPIGIAGLSLWLR